MVLYVLTGSNAQKKRAFIESVKQTIDESLRSLNFSFFHHEEFMEALYLAKTPAFVGTRVVVWQSESLTKIQAETLNEEELPDSNVLIFNLESIDGRLNAVRQLKQKATVLHFDLINAWDERALAEEVKNRSAALGLSLPERVIEYVVRAIGNNPSRLQRELEKLIACRGEETLTLKQVRDLIPCVVQNTAALATAMRVGDAEQTLRLSQELLLKGEHPLQILAILQARFQTWLKVKVAVEHGIQDPQAIAAYAGVGNFKRIYYLRQEVKHIPTNDLVNAALTLATLQQQYKEGLDEAALPYRLVAIAYYLAAP